MKKGEDEIVKFYACKTIENISAQSESAGILLATHETCTTLLGEFINGGKQAYINTAAVALSHIVKLNPSLFTHVIEEISIEDFCTVFDQGQGRIQQALITMLSIGLINKNEALFLQVNENPDALCQSLLKLLESQSLVIRGKALLTISLLIKHFPLQWFTLFINESKLLTILGHLTKDNYKYVQYGLMHFIDQVCQTIPIILSIIQEDMNYALEVGTTEGLEVDNVVESVMDRRKDFKNLKGHMTLVTLLLVVTTSSLLRSRVVEFNKATSSSKNGYGGKGANSNI